MIKQTLWRALSVTGALFLAVAMPLQVQAKTPSPLSRISLEDTAVKCADLTAFDVTYTFGENEVHLNADSAMNWFVTTASLERMRDEVRGEGRERSGYFLIDGKECAFPRTTRVENGFITDENGNLILSESEMYESMQMMFLANCEESFSSILSYNTDKYK